MTLSITVTISDTVTVTVAVTVEVTVIIYVTITEWYCATSVDETLGRVGPGCARNTWEENHGTATRNRPRIHQN